MSTSSNRTTPSGTERPLSCCSAANAPASPAASACCPPSTRSSSARRKLSILGNAVLREFALRETMY